jgi:tuftelin-interacting protein 11
MSSSSNDDDDEQQFGKLRQKKRRLNKDRAALGIFDDDVDDNVDDSQKKNALSKPLTFVSSGAAKKINVEHDVDHVDDDDLNANDNIDVNTDTNDDDLNARPAMTGARKVPADGKPLRRADTSFEKFTKGIGSKLLAKMGYVGGGMAPIDVKVRPKGIGIGFGNFDERTDGEKRREKEERDGKKPSSGGDDDEADVYDNDAMRNAAKAVAAEERARDGWKRGKQRTQRTQYITSLDHESRAAAESRTATINVIDMRGGPDAAGGAARKRMPELYYNVRLLVDLLRVELVELDAKQRARRDQLVTLDAEHERLVEQAANERERLVRVERVRGLVEECGKRVRERRIDLDQVGTMFGALRSSFAREYELFRLSRLVHALAVPLIKQRLRGWAPLDDPDPVAVASIFRTWRDVLLPPSDESAAAVLDDDTALLVATEAVRYDARLYHKLLEDHALPPLRLALMRAWRPAENSDAAVPLVLAWRDVMPRRVFGALLESLVVPRLERALHDERVDPLTMHRWLAVWQPIVGAAFEPLLPSVRRMLLRGAERCEARLDEAREALLAWADVGIDDASMQRVLERVVAAMERRLDATPIDPARPDSSALECVLRWFDFAPLAVPRLVHVLEEHFFAPWLAVTRQWLAGAARLWRARRLVRRLEALFSARSARGCAAHAHAVQSRARPAQVRVCAHAAARRASGADACACACTGRRADDSLRCCRTTCYRRARGGVCKQHQRAARGCQRDGGRARHFVSARGATV